MGLTVSVLEEVQTTQTKAVMKPREESVFGFLGSEHPVSSELRRVDWS